MAEKFPILVAEDDEDDRLLIKEALDDANCLEEIFFVENGEELLRFVKGEGKYEDSKRYPRPALILIDLNMPKLDGREAIKEIKSDELLKNIPIVVMTTSKAESDVLECYELGANSFVTKPVTYESMVSIMSSLQKYWFKTVKLPSKD